MSIIPSPRHRVIFEAVVQDYIRTAEPVGSKNLAERYSLNLSPASIRKVLAELESLGLLSQPHTSAGRTPTEEGFRVYVDEILEVGRLPAAVRGLIEKQLAGQEAEATSLFTLCTRVLTNLTSHMGVIMAPVSEKLWLKRLYFVRLGVRQVLSVLVSENGLIQNRLLVLDDDFCQDELNQVNVFLEEQPIPFTLDELRRRLLSAMGQERYEFEALFKRVLDLAAQAQLATEEPGDIPLYIDDEGRGRLLEHPDFADVEAMKNLFRAFENKRRLMELLNDITGGGRVRVVIAPSGEDGDGLALVASPYFGGEHGSGALGVLGPRRLNYSEIIPMVDYAARVVSGLFHK